MILKKLYRHYQYIFKEYFYILSVISKDKSFFLLAINLSLKFLFDAGLKNLINKRRYFSQRKKYENFMHKELRLTHDWFSHNITTWISVFLTENLTNKNLNILEIGSYEGSSAVFFLDYFKNSKISCIETFKGSDEHSNINFENTKKNFVHNLNKYEERLMLIETRSDDFFNKQIQNKFYDIVYVDGSHHFQDVYNDAINSFERLNFDGIIIFDDFLKKYYQDLSKDPIVAIFKFLKKHKKNIKILNVGYQIIIKKIK